MPNKSNSSIILQLYARTPAPCRDYCGLTLTHTEVILNIWHITFGPHVYPKRTKCVLEDFMYDQMLQFEINRIYGHNTLQYIKSLAKKELNLQNLPTKVFLNILNFLARRDIRNISQTSKILFNRCNMDNVWKIFFSKYFKRKPDCNEMMLAQKYGWKETLKLKLRKTIKLRSSVSRMSLTTISPSPKKVEVKPNNNKPPINNPNTKVLPKIINNVQNNKKIINKPPPVMQKRGLNNKLNSTKSTSMLERGKNNNVMRLNQISSTINLDNVAKTLIKKTLPQVKNDLKLNQFPQPLKKPDFTIEVPHPLKMLMARNNNSKPKTNNLVKK